MSVKRYALIGGRVDETVGHSHSCHTIYVREEDYAALEAHSKMVEANLREIEELLSQARQEQALKS